MSNVPLGTMISELSGPGIVRILHRVGFRFAIVDCEHGAFGLSELATMAAVSAEIDDFRLLVRIPAATRVEVGRVLDLGADGIVIPMVEDAEHAARIVQLAKYAPLGQRGVSVTRAHSGYGVDDLAVYLAEANARVSVFVQLESPGAVAHAAAIAAVDGVDGLIVGPNDFLQAIGAPGQLDHPALDDALTRVATTAADHGIASGVITSQPTLLARGASLGMSVLSLDSELGHLMRGARNAIDAFRGTGP